MKIVYFSPIRWNFLKQRPQHLAEELSDKHTICFVEPSVSFIHSLIYRNNEYKSISYSISPNLLVTRASGKYRLPKFFDLFDLYGINLYHEKQYLKDILNAADLIWISSPIYYEFATKSNKKIVYDKMDEYELLTKNPLMRRLISKNEKKLVEIADIIFTSSTKMYCDLPFKNKKVVLVRNGLDHKLCYNEAEFMESSVANFIKSAKNYTKKTVFGYIGTIDYWFDYEVIKLIVDYSDDYLVVIVGHNNIEKLDHPNIKYFDAVSKDELGAIIKEFDYGLYPFVRNELLDSIDPVKIYDYLSFNTKVISVRSNETERFSEYIHLYNTTDELRSILSHLPVFNAPFTADQLKLFIERNSWSKRAREIEQHLIMI